MKAVLASVLSVVVAASVAAPSFAQRDARRPRGPGQSRDEGKLKVGDPAPDFNLKTLHGKGSVKLSNFRRKKPVVLIFGSYT